MAETPMNRLVVALSHTEHDRPLIRYARLLADCGLGKEFQFVHVATPSENESLEAGHESTALAACQAMVDAEFGSPATVGELRCHVLTGVRVDLLIEFAIRSHSDCILLGHRASRSGQRSLARRLAMISPCSVWMVPEGAPVSITRVLAPVDFSRNAADSLETALQVAKAAGLQDCRALHAYFNETVIRYEETVELEQKEQQQAFANFLAAIPNRGVRVEPLSVEGRDVSRTILRESGVYGADLLVMNTRGRSRAAAILLGSVTTQVMIETKIAILAVKHYGSQLNLFEALRQSHFWERRNPKMN